VGPQTTIIPLLHGIGISACWTTNSGRERVLGGLCAIAATLNAQREVVHSIRCSRSNFGERAETIRTRSRHIGVFASGITARSASENIVQENVGKMGLPRHARGVHLPDADVVGDILASPGGSDFILGMLDESSAVAAAEGHAPSGPFFQRTKAADREGSQMTASMFRDIKRARPVEARSCNRRSDRTRRCAKCRCQSCASPTPISRRMRSRGGDSPW